MFEELKPKAEKTPVDPKAAGTDRGDQRSIIERRLTQRMYDLYAYFKEFQQQLTLVNPEIKNDFDIADLCTLKGLRQGAYQLTSDNSGHMRKFTFHYSLVGRGMREVKFPNRLVADRNKENLWRYGFKFRLKESSPTRCSLLIEAYVPVSFEFESDVERATVRLKLKNKPTPGISTYTYDADQIDAGFMDETAKYILDKPNSFDQLSEKPFRKKA